jgi:hypothetical protein
LLLVVFVPELSAAEPDAAQSLLKEAETAFAQGVERKAEPEQARAFFAQSARAYAKLYEQGFHNADLCRTWGQAEFLADRLPQAFLAWRLGLRLAPGDPGLLADLEYARDQVEYPTGDVGRPAENLWQKLLPWWTVGGLVLLALATYSATWVLGTCWLARRHLVLLLVTCVSLVFLVLWVVGLTGLMIHEREKVAHPLVVVTQAQILRRGNGNSYPANEKLSTVQPGMEAHLLFRRRDWLQIELAGGHVGWIPASSALIEPTSAAPGEARPASVQ